MSVLSAQSIRRLCTAPVVLLAGAPLITPFVERGVVNGKSYGLSACTYDCRIDQDLTLEPMPFAYITEMLVWMMERENQFHAVVEHFMRTGEYVPLGTMSEAPKPPGPWKALVSTIERFDFPHNVRGHVLDKSTYARVFVSAFNTHFDPGFDGHATIELVNVGTERVTYKRGDPVCQFLFEWLDEPTDLPYVGRKYSNQPARPVGAISEESDPQSRAPITFSPMLAAAVFRETMKLVDKRVRLIIEGPLPLGADREEV